MDLRLASRARYEVPTPGGASGLSLSTGCTVPERVRLPQRRVHARSARKLPLNWRK